MRMKWSVSPYSYQRRQTRAVTVGAPGHGAVIIGGGGPVVTQSMITADTMDTKASVRETLDLAAAGAEMVRITAPSVKAAANLEQIVGQLRGGGCLVPIVADIHFRPEAALEAAKWVDKVRINPGNFADSKKFVVKEYTDEQYAAELRRVEERFAPLVELCARRGRALRIGVNHGSLSDRVMNRFGDTPLGMVESALEFARVARKHSFHELVFSMKASSPKVMVQCYRMLAARLEELGPDWDYPLHLGVTEAGEGEDGRIKSAIGIGSLLCDGLGDTIRVSLTEDSVREIEVCRDLLAEVAGLVAWPQSQTGAAGLVTLEPGDWPLDPFNYQRRPSAEVQLGESYRCGAVQPVRVVVPQAVWERCPSQLRSGSRLRPEAIYERLKVREVDPTQGFDVAGDEALLTVKDDLPLPPIVAFRLLAARLLRNGRRNPILVKDCLAPPVAPLEPKLALLRSAVVVGSLLIDGIGDAVLVRNESDAERSLQAAYGILQAAGCRSYKTDYIACPSCGRTLFDLQAVTARIKARTGHLPQVKIAIMGCVVNGPGEMADADFGYVGGAPGKVNLYVGKQPERFNVPEAEAVDRLVDLLREHGKWIEPESSRSPAS
jgi:(E)-4-hydroxy-3-methylbut-2-enyl-diphosphate synthase